MLEWMDQIDRQLFLMLNSWNNPAMDEIMFRLTSAAYWTPLFVLVLYFVFRVYGRKGFLVVLGITLTILLADQITFRFMKPFFGRLRPSHQPELEGLVHIVNGYRGGKYGFASSHAANSFGVAMFLFAGTASRLRWIWVMFVWAAVFSYTRIYLGVHYPGDIIAGALVGMGLGYLVKVVLHRIPRTNFSA